MEANEGWLIGWKVFLRVDGVLCSYVMKEGRPGFMLYPEGEVVERRPECGALAVFRDYYSAKDFDEGEGLGGFIRKVEYRPSTLDYLMCRTKYGYGKRIREADEVPPGTVFADALRLLPLEETHARTP